MDDTISILATGLTKRYRDIPAVKDVSLKVHSGEIYGFLGLNGAGKTTTIRMLLGMIKPSAGSVSLFGVNVHPGITSIWQRVGNMVETPHAYPDLTVRENLELVRVWRKMKDTGAVDKVMEQLSLTSYANRRAKALSLGNAQRLGLAAALIHHPDLLILDEPSNGLDPAGTVEIRNLLLDLANKQGATIFMSSHILGEVARLATRIGVIHEGQLVKEFDTGKLADHEQQRLIINVNNTDRAVSALRQARITTKVEPNQSLVITNSHAMQHPDEINTLLVQADCPPTKLLVEQGDLESYFLSLVGLKEEK
jgi:ABC-2 type transport system ATP-binding protein